MGVNYIISKERDSWHALGCSGGFPFKFIVRNSLLGNGTWNLNECLNNENVFGSLQWSLPTTVGLDPD